MVFAHDGDQLFHIFFGHISWRVKPNDRDWTVLTGDLFNLWQALLFEVVVEGCRFAVFVCARTTIATGKGPVLIVRIVKAESQSGFSASGREILHRVSLPRSRVDDVEITRLRIVHRESIVMLAGDHDVLHASVLGEPDDFFGVEFDWIESLGKTLVLFFGNPSHSFVHDPLADTVVGFSIDFVGDLRVQPPVNEHRVVAHIE